MNREKRAMRITEIDKQRDREYERASWLSVLNICSNCLTLPIKHTDFEHNSPTYTIAGATPGILQVTGLAVRCTRRVKSIFNPGWKL